MEIKFKLFTTIAQALDKLKKQFDKTDKSLVKTQTTLDETIVNIDNVVDSVARTMTEALDPYFVDMIYGYIDDNGKFKLGIIKNPWKDIDVGAANIDVIIPNNTTQLYHWGDIDIFSNITVLNKLLEGKNITINLDILKLFPNLQSLGQYFLYNASINELIIPITIQVPHYGISKCIINKLVFDYRNSVASSSFSDSITQNTINSLEIINTPSDSVVPFPVFGDNNFKFNSTNDIKGWEYITRLNPLTFNFQFNKIDEIYIHSGITVIDALFITGPIINYSKISILSFEGANKRITGDALGYVYVSNIKDLKIDNFENLSTYMLDATGLLLSQKYINYENLYIGDELITDTLEIPETITIINDYIFSGNTHIKNVILHDKLTYIGILALPPYTEKIYLTNLAHYLSLMLNDNIIIGGNLDTNRKLYLNNELIEDLVIPDDITELKYAVFRSCVFETVDLNNVVNIYKAGFYQTHIGYINGENVENIDASVFYYCNCNLINFPNVINLGKWAFEYAIIKDIKIPKIKTLDYGCFRACESNKIIIPEGVTLLPAYCFALSKIGYIVLPSTLTNITTETVNDKIFGDNAVVYIKSVTPPDITHTLNSSTHHKSYTIYVPTNSVEAYKSHTRYANIKDRIFPYDFELNPDNIQLDYE